MAAQVIPRPGTCTLYELEDNLQALVNSIDLAEDPSARESILEEIGQALRPRGSPQNRPMRITSKPANGTDSGQDHF
jgi:hypothetical protein